MTMFTCQQCGHQVTKAECMVEGIRCERLADAPAFPKPKLNPELDAFLAKKEQP